jgi:hypothetical protein
MTLCLQWLTQPAVSHDLPSARDRAFSNPMPALLTIETAELVDLVEHRGHLAAFDTSA